VSLLQVEELQVRYGSGRTSLLAVDRISLQVEPGASLGVVGESGSGKSTLARAIVQLIRSSSGRIVLDGRDVTNARGGAVRHVRDRVQMVFQDPFSTLNPRRTIGATLEEAVGIRQRRDRARHEKNGEVEELLQLVLAEDSVTFEGEFYRFRDVTIQPRPASMPRVWVSGGGRVADVESPDRETMAPRVVKRIAGADGWLSRSAADLDLIKRDWAVVSAEVRRQRGTLAGFTFGHCNFIHVVETEDEVEALRTQREPFMEIMGTHRPFEQLQRSYLLGTPAQQVARLVALHQAGCEYFVLGPTSDDPRQIELLMRLVVEPLISFVAKSKERDFHG